MWSQSSSSYRIADLESLAAMQILRPPPRLTESESPDRKPECYGLRTTALLEPCLEPTSIFLLVFVKNSYANRQ